MKKAFLVLAVLSVLFTGCPNPAGNTSQASMTIKNESSYDLSNVTWAGVSFASAGSSDLLKGTLSKKNTTEEASGYVYFTRKDIGINLRTQSISTAEDSPVTLNNNTVVVEIGNDANSGALSQISRVPVIGIEYGGMAIGKNESIDAGQTMINGAKQMQFVVQNTGSGPLSFTGTAPVSLSGGSNAFSVTQPASPTIASGGSLPFTITFTPSALETVTTTVTVKSNAPSGDFSFAISATGIPSKPLIGIFNGTTEIAQNGTIDMGTIFLPQSGTVTVTIRNNGTEPLTLTPGEITKTGGDAEVFLFDSLPSGSISVNATSILVIRCTPAQVRGYSATISIPNNDTAKNPAIFLVNATGSIVPPGEVSGSALSSSSIEITWSAVDGASSYKVYRSTASVGLYTYITDSSATSYTDSGLNAGTTYYYKVSACGAGGEGTQSASASATTYYAANNSTAFSSAVAAINNSTAGGEYRITITGNFAATGVSFTGNAGKTITLEGDSTIRSISNGNTSAPLFVLPNGIELVLGNNITLNGANKSYPVVRIENGGTLTMNSGAKIIGAAHSGVSIEGGIFTMNDGEISGNSVSTSTSSYDGGGGVYISSGSFTMSGGTISGNSVSSSYNAHGGGVYISGGVFTMSGGSISGNSVSSTPSYSFYFTDGGGVYIGGGAFTMSGGTISGNSVSSYYSTYGGGVYVKSGGSFNKTGGIITDTNSLSPANNTRGRVAYVAYGKYRETEAGSTVNLNSATEENWE